MKSTLLSSALIALLTATLLGINYTSFSIPEQPDRTMQEKPPAQGESEALGMRNPLILDIGIMVSDETPETGVPITYTINYSTQSLTEDADNPVIDVPLPNGIEVLSFQGNAEVANTGIVDVMGTPTFRITMVNPLEAGAAGILTLQVVIPPGQVCDGTVIPASVTFSADDADNSPVNDAVSLTASAPNQEWNVDVSAVTIGVPGATSLFEVSIEPSALTGYIALDNATLTADIPVGTNVVNCSGCMQSGTTLTWDVSNASGPTSFPVILEFPSPPYNFSDPFSIDAELDGTTISDCPVDVDDTDTLNGMLPMPNPQIQCGVELSTFRVEADGVYTANAEVTGNVEVDNFTATISIPEQIEVSSIAPSTYLYDGIPVTVNYETNLSGGPVLLGMFNTTLDGSSGGFAIPALGAGEYLTTVIFEFGTVPPGFGPVGGIQLSYEVLVTDQLGNPVVGANPRITSPTYVSCPNMTYTCIEPVVEVTADYEGNPLPTETCTATDVARIPPVGPGSPVKSAPGGPYFVGQEVTYTLTFNVCGPDPLVNGLVTDNLPSGIMLVPGSVMYSSNITDIGTPAFNEMGSTLTWDFAGIDLPGSTMVDEDCGETYTIQYTVEVTEVANGPGSSVLNNSFTIDGDDVDIAPEAPLPGDDENISIPPIGPTDLTKSSLDGSSGNPEDTITFRLRFRNQGPFDVNNVVIADQLPMGLDFVPGTIQYGGGLTPADNNGMEYDGGTRTLTFEWATLSGSDAGDQYSEFYDITYDVAVPQGFPPGTLQNCFTVDGTGDDIRQDLPLQACENFTVNALVQTTSSKGVRGDCDDNYVFFDPDGPTPDLNNLNGIGRTFQGGTADWRLVIQNTGNVAVKNITVIDILPFVGDEAVSFPAARESQWRTNFVEIISVPGTATVEYSIEQNPCRAGLNPSYEPSGCTGPFWSATPPVDITETQALKFFLPDPLGPGASVTIEFRTQSPVEAPVDEIAWNSLAYQGRRTDTPGEEFFLIAEPNKVGIAIKEDTVSVGNYVWVDENNNGLQDEPAELGVNSVAVSLYRLVGDKDATPGSDDDVFIGTTLTADDNFGQPGYYLFPNLPAGQYYAVFDETTFPPGLVPPENMPTLLNQGVDDTIDSDADQSTMFMTDVTPLLTELGQPLDTTLDLGLRSTECELFPEVMVFCDDRSTAQVSDDRFTWNILVNREITGSQDNTGTFTLQVMDEDGNEIDVVPNLAYGVEHPMLDVFGPFQISGGDLMFEVKDDVDLSCEAFGVVEAPATLNIANVSSTDCMDDGMGNLTYDLTGQVQIGGSPAPGARLEVFFTDNGTPQSQIFDPIAEDGTYNFSFNGLICNGQSFDIEAQFIDPVGDMIDGTCTAERRFNEPCYLEVTDIQITDNCRADGTYTVDVIGTYYNGTGNMTISIDGNSPFSPAMQTLPLSNLADGEEVTLASFTKTCDGQLHEVTASFNGSCMDMANFEGPRDRDFGDVPDTYGTTLTANGAFHIIHDDLFLGDCVDSELDGSPEAQAGVDGTPSAGPGTGGDDGSGVETEPGEVMFSDCMDDDEDGIEFVTAMIPGNDACVEVTATNTTGSDAVLQMWVDFDGNGSFSAAEEVTFTNPAVTAGTTITNYCFEVPETATFPDLETFIRVRLSSAGGLDATGPANDGEVEDYYLAFATLGDYVWEDDNLNGVQEGDEAGVPDIQVVLYECNSDVKGAPLDTTFTDNNGNYIFTGLLPGEEYCVLFDLPNSTNPDAEAYLFTTQDQTDNGGDDTNDSDANPADGCTPGVVLTAGEEYEDFDAGIYRLDFGDLEEQPGIATTTVNNGAAHSVPTNVLLKLGLTVDAEPDGQPSTDALGDGIDEDGVMLPMFVTGTPVDVTVSLMNMTGQEAKLVFFIDWNGDGDFEDTDEMYDLMVPDNATEAVFEDVIPPLIAVTEDQQVSVRFRISTDADAVMTPTGIAPDGEVEDYITPITGFDFGDLNDVVLGTSGDPNDPNTPADYATIREGDGPRHRIISDVDGNVLLKIGAVIDDEANGQPSTDAGATSGGDDNTATPDTDPDDEDGLDLGSIPPFSLTRTTTLDIPVMNMSGSAATLALFLDFDKNGSFDPITERFSVAVPVNATMVSIDVPVPITAVVGQNLGLRLRLANDSDEVATAMGEAQSGEVEDYMVQISGFDYGDLPVSYGTQDPDAPKHILTENLLMGQCVDAELDGQPDAEAEGDDDGAGQLTFGMCSEAGDDEDGVDFITPLVAGTEACVLVNAVNNTGSGAVMQLWIDWDGSGDFGAGEEVTFTAGNDVPNGGLTDALRCFEVPETAIFEGGSAYSRVRLSPDGGLEPDEQTGSIPFGEIEDYEETLYLVGSYIWEDFDGDGLQGDFSTPCLNDYTVELTWAGPDDNLNTTADNEVYSVTTAEVSNINGQYNFQGLIPGTYQLQVTETPTGFVPTTIGAGTDDDLDSNDPDNTIFTIEEDGTLTTSESGTGDQPGNINGYPDDQDNLSFDFGFQTDGYQLICNCDGSITLDWEPFSTGDNWTVDVEDENGNPVVDFVNMSSTQVTFVPGTLMNGVCYNFAITENLGNAEVEAISGLLHANCNPVPVLALSGEGPSCPSATDGFLTIDLQEQGCSATYDIFLVEAGVGEQQVGTAATLDQPFLVENLGEGLFRVRLELADRGNCAYGEGCLPEFYTEEITLETTDEIPPIKTVEDESGQEPPMSIVYESVPEGVCGVQFSWFVELNDNCLPDPVTLEAEITTDSAVGSSATVTPLDEENNFEVFVQAGIGNNILLLIVQDEAGNADTMAYEITVADNRAPEIYGPGDMQVQIPACEETVPVNWQVSAVDDCDLQVELVQISGPEPGDILAPGMYTVVYEATDNYGNSSQYSFEITVTQAPSPVPVVDVSGNGQFVIEDCEEDGFMIFSGHIYDCDLEPGDDLTGLISISGAPLTITYILVNEGYAYFEATGDLTPDTYVILTSYEGVAVDHLVEVVQDPDTPAEITMPGNLTYQVPNCEGEADVSFAVQLEDDCDEDFSDASFTINGLPAPPFDPAESDPVNGYFFWNLNLSPGTYVLAGTYTDGGGNTTESVAEITVNAANDTGLPVIVYPAQNIVEELDPCGPPETEICFQATATDDCEGNIAPEVIVTDAGGNMIPLTVDGNTYCFTAGPGQYTVSLEAMDAAGNTTSEAFGVTITQDPAPEANLGCNDNLNVTLDENCSYVITADMVLEGSFGCLAEGDFNITIVNDDNPANGNILDGPGEWIYEIDGPEGLLGFQDCWGYITGEDKTAPVITCPPNNPADFLITAFDLLYGGDAGSIAQQTAFIEEVYPFTGAPSATDNCSTNIDITATDSFTSSGDCADIVITRTFTATDPANGYTDACTQIITLRPPTLTGDVNFPEDIVEIDCGDSFEALPNGAPVPEVSGFPTVADLPVFGDQPINYSIANLGAAYEDRAIVQECDGTFKLNREWTVYDWCDPGATTEFTQLIKVGDFTAPELTCPSDEPLVYSTNPFSCGGSFEAPMPEVSDNCSGVSVYTELVTVTEEEVMDQYGFPTGTFVTDTVVVRSIQPGANRFVASIPFGNHLFRYVATDDCGNEAVLYCPFEVIDEIEPVAVCDDQLNVSIGGGNIVPGQPALARIYPEDIDEGSWDNCGDVTLKVFRSNFDPVNYTCGTQNSVPGDFVDFFCCDVGVTSDITLVVTDQYGNENTCWLSVTPEDKINPTCQAPSNVGIDCDDLPDGFDTADAGQLADLFGSATGADNCGVASVSQVAANADLECGYGSVTRIFRATDVNGLNSTNSCVQVVTINEVHNYEIYFPEDAEANCGTPTPDTLEYNEIGCDLLAVTSSDEQFSASGVECYKIFRTWKVVNWCQYDGESEPYVLGRDLDCNGIPGDGDRVANNGAGFWLLVRPDGKIYFDKDTDETSDNNVPGINFCGTSNDYYDFDNDESGYYQYTQVIKVFDDVAPAISFTQADAFCSLDNIDCDANVTYNFTIDEDCTPNDLTLTVAIDAFNTGNFELLSGVVSGTYPDFAITGSFPIGNHTFEVVAEDGCGNSTLVLMPLSVVDCKAPAPICLNGIAVELMPVDENGDNLPDPGVGNVEIWASDFVNVGSEAPDCSEPIKYSINRIGEPNSPNQSGMILDCDDVGNLVVEVWAYDAAGNGDFCETYILVQDNMGVCSGAGPMAAGSVYTPDDEPVEEVTLNLSGQSSASMVTANDGAYVFNNLNEGLDYTITPERDGDYLNGVSTFDLVLISKHILGLEPLNTPYKRIAADVNNSGTITTLDMIRLRKLILSINTDMQDNTSWRFVEADYVFPDPENPWAEAFPEVLNINDLPANGITGADFIAVKIGDVTGDAIANSLSVIDERSFEGVFQLQTPDQLLKTGNEYRIPFTAPQLPAIEGFQGTLEFDAAALELLEIIPGVAEAGNFGLTRAENGKIAMSWNRVPELRTATEAGHTLFTLVCHARSDLQLSNALKVSDAITLREAYRIGGGLQEVSINFTNNTAAVSQFVLYQNQPNPFRSETVIGFELPESLPATVRINDVTGRVLRTYEIDGAKGYNQVTVKVSDLAGKGIVSYTVTAGEFSATKQMVIVE